VVDLQLVATMLANDVQRIYTFNAKDFELFPERAVVIPQGNEGGKRLTLTPRTPPAPAA
jgi:hypothetical protein